MGISTVSLSSHIMQLTAMWNYYTPINETVTVIPQVRPYKISVHEIVA